MAVNDLSFTTEQLKKAQEKLSASGYDIDDVNGSMTDKTRNAIIKYKSDNNLADDNAALASLYGGTAENTGANGGAMTGDAYNAAIAALQQAQKTVPATLSGYTDQLTDIYNQIINRDKFSYDIDADALYQQYKDQYTTQGKLAMKDTMGQAAALTGGYSSSYAQGVGQQQYDAYLQRLNDVVPELYGQAKDEYDAEGSRLQQLYALTSAARDSQYDKDMNSASLLAQYGDFSGMKELYGEDKGKLMEDTWFLQNPDLALKLGLIDQSRYNSIMGIVPGQNNGGGWDGYISTDGAGMTTEEIKELQASLGLDVDGIYGRKTEAAAKAILQDNNTVNEANIRTAYNRR